MSPPDPSPDTPRLPEPAPLAEALEIAFASLMVRGIRLAPKPPAPPLWRRLWKGVRDHIAVRWPEWWATGEMIQFGWVLYFPPSVFETSPNLRVMGMWATEEHWGALCLFIGAIHFAALLVNGTFQGFRWSPVIRAVSALVGVFLWAQVTLAIWLSHIGGTGLVTYRWMGVFWIICFFRACLDVANMFARGGHGSRHR